MEYQLKVTLADLTLREAGPGGVVGFGVWVGDPHRLDLKSVVPALHGHNVRGAYGFHS